ncbi:MAG: dihydrolipoyl dehydrogenase [Candidatus Limivivens sp.]|nr:dihydrolipoyl dehydrogenase [Candidatus Limivivens sp.]
MAEQYDLIVIGAGPGGYLSAVKAASKGMKTAVVEEREIGGTCLNRGCIPTKTIMHSTELLQEIKSCGTVGISVGEASCSMDQVQEHKEAVLEQLRAGIAALFKKSKITLYQGKGQITGAHSVKVGEEELTAKNILIVTGSVPAMPPIPGMDLPGVLNSDGLLAKGDPVPEKLVIIGGGVIGMEFASIYQALGTQVTVIEALDRILATLDKEIGQSLKMLLKKRGVDIHTGAKVEKITEAGEGILSVTYTEKDKPVTVEADTILVAVGRRAYTEGLLGPGVELAMDRGKICVDEHFQTSIPGIYAAGDCIGGIQLAHVASAEAINAVCHMNGEEPEMDLSVVPSCVYTSPEIASVGLSAEEAKAAGRSVLTAKYPMSANGKSLLSGQERGFIKVLADPETHRILGAQMMCARATDMISEFGMAIANGLTAEQMASVIRPHPTFSEGISEAAELLL